MNHTPYMDWLYEDRGELDTEQAKALSIHLSECSECRMRADALRQVEGALQARPMAAPAHGFAQRWQARLQEERRRAHTRQTRLALGVSLSALVTVLAMLAILSWPYLGSFKLVFWGIAYQLMSFYYLLVGIGEFAAAVLAGMAGVIPLFGWLFAIGLIVELGVLWVVSYRLLTNPRRIENA